MRDLIRHAGVAAGAAVVLALGAFAPVAAQAVAATTLYVSHGGSNSAPCTSARPCATVTHALTKAASGATIKVSGTIKDHLYITTSRVSITNWPGGPARSPAVLDGTGSGTVVYVPDTTAGVTLRDVTIEDGSVGIYNQDEEATPLTVTDSTVSGNKDISGEAIAGIFNQGAMTIIDSTVTKNSGAPGSSDVGAGVYNQGYAMKVIASTIAGNTGGGIFSGPNAPATLGATIVADNTGGPNCSATGPGKLVSVGYNLTNDKTGKACAFTAATDHVNKNPLLGHLASNGGPTKTLLPGVGGPADDVIPKGTILRGVKVCPGADQRGAARPAKGETRCTIGAVEV